MFRTERCFSKQNRRQMLQCSSTLAGLLATTGFLPLYVQASEKAAFDTKNIREAIKILGGALPIESKDVMVTGPDVAEDGSVVRLGFGTNLAGVKKLLLLVEKNPSVLVAVFNVTPEVEANFYTHTKMDRSSDVYAVAITDDSKAFFAKKEVKVTLGGCGN
jgi:sulfur-oxidizing protein SoxY